MFGIKESKKAEELLEAIQIVKDEEDEKKVAQVIEAIKLSYKLQEEPVQLIENNEPKEFMGTVDDIEPIKTIETIVDEIVELVNPIEVIEGTPHVDCGTLKASIHNQAIMIYKQANRTMSGSYINIIA